MENGANEGICVPEEHLALVSSLPLELSFVPFRLRLFQGCWIPEHFVPSIIHAQRFFRPRPADVFLASYPKCGATWLKALAFAAVTRNHHSLDSSHPLHTLNPHECVHFLDGKASTLDEIDATDDHEPRLVSTHLPFDLLPDSVKNSSSCRLVYILREPKDVVVSGWHYWKMRPSDSSTLTPVVANEALPLGEFIEMFSRGILPYGSIWEHVLSYWNESLRAPKRVMILKYEELLEDPVGQLLKLAEFMGCGFTEEEVVKRVPEEIVSLCNFANLRDLGIKQDREVGKSTYKTDSFYRKGVAGDWREYLSPEMEETFDHITREKLHGTGLSLGH